MIGVLTVSATSAQEVADKMVKGGVKTILNFVPTHIILSQKLSYTTLIYLLNLKG